MHAGFGIRYGRGQWDAIRTLWEDRDEKLFAALALFRRLSDEERPKRQ